MQALIDSAFFGPSKQYVRWDTGLHEVFEQAVEELGGPHAAKPAVIRERMGISLLTTAQVKSHLQKYRIRVVAEKGSEHATEAQARAAQQLLERQKRQGLEGASIAPRPRAKVPIRGSRQAGAAGGGATAAGSKRSGGGRGGSRRSGAARKRRRTGSATWSDDEEDDFDAEVSLSEGEEAEPSPGTSEGGSQGEGRSASTTTTRRAGARAQAVAAAAAQQQKQRQQQQEQQQQRQRQQQQQQQHEERRQQGVAAQPLVQQLAQPPLSISVQECDAVPLAELSRRLRAEGLQLDASTMQGLASRQLGLAAAAAAAAAAGSSAAGRQPSGGSGELASTALPPAAAAAAAMAAAANRPPPAVPASNAVLSAGSVLSSAGAVAALNRQVQLEQALLEQSMWVQKLAAEVQDLRQRQRLGLPPPVGDSSAFATPFAAMAGAAFPGGLPEPADSRPAGGNLATCDSTLLRLLSTTLGQASSWKPGEGSDAVAAAVKDGDVTAAAAAAAAEAVASLHRGGAGASDLTAGKQLPKPAGGEAAAVQAAAHAAAHAAAAAAANPLLSCDSGLLRLLSRSLYDSIPQPLPALSLPAARQGSGAIGLSLGPDVQAAIAQAAAAAAAAMGPAAAAAALGPAALGGAAPGAALHAVKQESDMQPASAPAALDAHRPAGAGEQPVGAARSPPAPTPFASAAAQALAPALLPPGPASALPMMSTLGATRPPQMPGAPPQLDAFSSSLLTLGLAGAGGAAGGLPLSTAEFLRLCSLPGAADLLPQPFELGGN